VYPLECNFLIASFISLSEISFFNNDFQSPGVLNPAKCSATFLSLVHDDKIEFLLSLEDLIIPL
jgi:hypothetical protein